MKHRIVALAIPILALVLSASSSADVGGGDFDAMPLGPYPFLPGDAEMLQGNPLNVQIIQAGMESGAPTIPNGEGHVLCLDARFKNIPQILEFSFSCDIDPAGICRVKYDFSGGAWIDGGGFEAHVDADGEYDNPDQTWSPPVVFPPSTIEGSNTEGAGVCDGSGHTIAFVVFPGTVLYLDNMTTVCEVGTVSNDALQWGRIKALYR
jgi:hypothetical protein